MPDNQKNLEYWLFVKISFVSGFIASPVYIKSSESSYLFVKLVSWFNAALMLMLIIMDLYSSLAFIT